ncbi:MAG: crossover junction endodeoxyribonuclease RuvC [Patescibacteria group bacterium]|jgi:crossover junction endodeoxyribonuclease RuvC
MPVSAESVTLIGIDPGIADAGFGVIEQSAGRPRCLAYGSLKTPAGMPGGERLRRLHENCGALLDKYRPAEVGIEKLFFSKNVKTAIAVAEARGVIRLCIEERGIPCREFSPGEVKDAVSGYGAAGKKQVQAMVKALLGLKEIPKPDDAADALALAITLANTSRLAAKISRL